MLRRCAKGTAEGFATTALPAASRVWGAPTGFIFLSPDWTAQTYFVVINGIYMLVSGGGDCSPSRNTLQALLQHVHSRPPLQKQCLLGITA